jgi:hypothetical protein
MTRVTIEFETDEKAAAFVASVVHDGWIRWDPYDDDGAAHISVVDPSTGDYMLPPPPPRRRRRGTHRRA